MSVFEDQQFLVSSLRSKDDKAFEYLYDNYSKSLFGIITRIIKDLDEASDVLQEVFIIICEKISMFNPDKGKLFTWILRIAVNKSLDALRKKEKKYNSSLDNLISENFISRIKFAHKGFSIDSIGLDDIISKLKPDLKEIIELHYFKGFTHQEITDMKGIPLGTVKSKLRSAMGSLKYSFGVL